MNGSDDLLASLRAIVGRRHVITRAEAVAFYATGYRVGSGEVSVVVRPASMVELWLALNACVEAGHIVIPQAANTGLTGGSTPAGDYDRPVVIINTMRIGGVRPIAGGRQVLCLAGSKLHELEAALAPMNREPHSVIGSSCIGASVIGGVCNNSGGALVQRGPAYTEYALYAQVDADGQVHLRNRLGIRLGSDPIEILRRIDENRFSDADIECDARQASAADDYAKTVRDVDATTPARFNADPAHLFEAAGSAGKLIVFAVRLDTFAAPQRSSVFYLGTNAPDELTRLRRHLLMECKDLPVSGEYIHREAFDIAAKYGKDTVLAIRLLGTARIPLLFALKARIDNWAAVSRILPAKLADRLLQGVSRLLPQHLPHRLRDFRDRFEHHLILKVADGAIEPVRAMLSAQFASQTGDMFECDPGEAQAAMLHRFAVAGAAVRYRTIAADQVEDVVAIDVALRRNDPHWFETLPEELSQQLMAKLYYGHFLCHVFHQDYLIKKGCCPVAFEQAVLKLFDERGGEYPAEHNVGHLYRAKPALEAHYRALDPGNRLNPGIGGMSRRADYE